MYEVTRGSAVMPFRSGETRGHRCIEVSHPLSDVTKVSTHAKLDVPSFDVHSECTLQVYKL